MNPVFKQIRKFKAPISKFTSLSPAVASLHNNFQSSFLSSANTESLQSEFSAERISELMVGKISTNFVMPVQIEINGESTPLLVKGNTVKHTQFKTATFTRIVLNEYLTVKDAQSFAFMDSARMFLMNFPFTGGCCVLKINPNNFGLGDQESIMRRYCVEVYRHNAIGAAKAIYYPGLGSSENNMSKFIDTFRTLFPPKDLHDQASIVGKTHNNSGIVNRRKLLSLWMFNALKKCLSEASVIQKSSMEPITSFKGKTFILKVMKNQII